MGQAPDRTDTGDLLERLETLHQIGLALSAEKELALLLEKILTHSRDLTSADAGTVYVRDPGQDRLRFAVLQNDTLELELGGERSEPLDLDPIPLHLEDGRPNHEMVAAYVALEGKTVNIADAYQTEAFDFSGTRRFDRESGYRSTSFLTVPMKDHDGHVVGVLQLINARDDDTREIVPFTKESEIWIQSLASQAAVALDNRFETAEAQKSAERLERLSEIGLSLSAEKDIDVLLERILLDSKWIANSDGGTLYMVSADGRHLRFEMMRNDSLGTALGGSTGQPIDWEPVPLYRSDGSPNHQMVAAHVALTGETVNIPDAYEAEGFDFSGPRKFDAAMSYRSRSFLTVPLKDHENELLGVLQLINAREPDSGDTIPFSLESQKLVESLASQAAVALTNRKLIQDLKDLFDAFIRSIAGAIDRKSPHTGAHCQRVPVLTLMIADAAREEEEGPLAGFEMDEDQRYELGVAAWLHDCGKVTTPEHVVEKSRKLETVYDRIEAIRARFEILKRDLEIRWLRGRLEGRGNGDRAELDHRLTELDEEMAFLERCNLGGEFMDQELQDRVRKIAQRRWQKSDGEELPLLSEDEVENLTISKGTLTQAERQIINDHVVATLEMLEELPFPKKLGNVPEFAGGHHEKIDGTGYPKGLRGDQMSLQARMMAIADIFEALTAPDRPYRKPNTLSGALTILGFMKQDGHVDPDLFDLFVRREVFLTYAREHLSEQQIDEVDLRKIPGFVP